MKKTRKFIPLLFCCLFMCLLLFPQTSKADSLTPTAQDNLSVRLRRSSDLIPVSDGYMRVFKKSNSIGIEYYDNRFQITGKKEIAMELPLWGGFYAGSDGYYLVEGQNNTAEDSSAEVIRVIRYDTNWNRNGAASITSNPDLFGGEVRYPFDYGCVEMTETNGTLYIVTAHEGYVDPSVGQGHQGFLMIAVDQASMTGKIVRSDLWHSFAQYIKSNSSYLYVLEQSEGSRRTQLSRYDSTTLEKKTIELLSYGGSRTSVWALPCYASVDGMAVSSDNVLCIGTTIDQSKYDSAANDPRIPHNIYLTVTPTSSFSEAATSLRYLTNYTGDGKSFLGVKITKITDDRFMVSWEEYEQDNPDDDTSSKYESGDDSLSSSTLHYLFIDGKGNTISKEFTTAAPVSDCQPVIKDSKVVYYASNENTVNFYSIDANDGNTTKKIYRTAGDNATWDFSNGILTISGQGAISVTEDENYRSPVSSIGGQVFYSDTAWKSIKNQVKKIVIKSGITSICEKAFTSLPALKEVEVENGVIKIGAKAFAYCNNLEKVTLPASISVIGEDIVWTGSYWTYDGSHVNYATIYAPYGSAAITYAQKNKVSYACDLSGAAVTGINSKYTYTGSSLKPKPTVTLGNKKLTADSDYEVTYSKNKNVGTATVKITGIGNYYGTITRNFQIVSAQNTPTPAPVSKTFKDAYNTYTVNKTGTSVTLKKPNSKVIITATIPSSVKANGKTYKVTAIAPNAFKNCRKLKQATISKNVSSIGSGAFQGCSSLRTLKIGSKVSSIGAKAFYDCRALTSVTIQSKKLTSGSVGKSAFAKAGRNNYKKLKVKVPESRLSAYKKLLKAKGLSSKTKVTK